MGRIIPYIMENKKCSKPPTSIDIPLEYLWLQKKQSPAPAELPNWHRVALHWGGWAPRTWLKWEASREYEPNLKKKTSGKLT